MYRLSYLLLLTIVTYASGLPTDLEVRSNEYGHVGKEERSYNPGNVASDMTIVTHNDLYG
jgi:hypothetical protein